MSFQSLPREIATCHSSHGGEFGGRIDSVKDASRARAGEAGAIARCLQRAFFRTPYGILARIDSASPVMLGPCDEWRNPTLTGGSNPNFYSSLDRSRLFQASQSVLTFRQTLLTTSLPAAPANKAASARRTRRGLVKAKISPGDQRVGLPGAPLVSPRRFALPFRRVAVFTDDPGTRDGDLGRPECAGQRSHPMTMPMAGNRHRRVIRRRQLQPPPVARPRQRRIEFFLDHRLDEAAHFRSQTCLGRIEPIVEKFSSATSTGVFVVSLFMA